MADAVGAEVALSEGSLADGTLADSDGWDTGGVSLAALHALSTVTRQSAVQAREILMQPTVLCVTAAGMR